MCTVASNIVDGKEKEEKERKTMCKNERGWINYSRLSKKDTILTTTHSVQRVLAYPTRNYWGKKIAYFLSCQKSQQKISRESDLVTWKLCIWTQIMVVVMDNSVQTTRAVSFVRQYLSERTKHNTTTSARRCILNRSILVFGCSSYTSLPRFLFSSWPTFTALLLLLEMRMALFPLNI